MTAKPLATRRHTVFRLAPDLLLVFKPRGHREEAHAHAHQQRLRVLRGALRLRIGARSVTLRPGSRPFHMRAGLAHETLAVQDTWLVAEAIRPTRPRVVTPRQVTPPPADARRGA